MAHYSRLSEVVIDVPPAEHDRELAFWQAAIGQPLTRFDQHPEYHGTESRARRHPHRRPSR
jgi:hypothetical protein